MDYEKREKNMPVCLECGDRIRYGRADKKFCCDECKVRHYNNLAKVSRAYRRKIMNRLSRNYQILEQLVKAGESSVGSMPSKLLKNQAITPENIW